MEEIWKDIKGYEGLYQVSNKGQVKSVKRIVARSKRGDLSVNERILKTRPNRNGYKMAHLSKNGREKVFTVHRLVAIAFIPNPNSFPQINHKDENKLNNCVDNLEWCDNKYNCNYGTATERMLRTKREKYNLSNIAYKGQATKIKNRSRCMPVPVNQFTWDGVFVKRFFSSEQVKRELGIFGAYSVAQGRIRHAGGYIWLYDEDVDKIKERVLNRRPEKRILQYDREGNFLRLWNSQKEAAVCLGLCTVALCACLHGKVNTCGGFVWKYYNSDNSK